MGPGQRFFIPASFVVVMIAAPAAAQPPYDGAELTGFCLGTTPSLTVQLDIINELPAEWTGWVVDRTTIGACEPVTTVLGPTPFPDGAQVVDFNDYSAAAGTAYLYRLRPVDAEGNRYYFSAAGTFPPGYYQTAFTTCGEAVAARGRLRSGGMPYIVEGCAGQCWLTILSVYLPDELLPLVDTNAVVELHGTIGDEFEGPYLDITSWTILPDCGIVPTTSGSWSGLKAAYR